MTFGRPWRTSLPGVSITHCLNHSLLPFHPLSPTRVPSFSPRHLLKISIHFAEQSPSAVLAMDALTYVLILISSESFKHMKELYQRPQHSFGIIFLKSSVVLYLTVRTTAHLLGGLRLNTLQSLLPCSKKPSNPSAVFSFLSLHPVSPLIPPSKFRCLCQPSS